MIERERSTAARPAREIEPQAGIESLPTMFGRLGDDVMKLLDTKLSLAKVEIKEDAARYARSGAMIAAGAVLALMGFILANVAVACFISALFGKDEAGAVLQKYGPTSYGIGFLITGVVHLLIGGILVYVGKNRIASHNPMPERSVEELKRDKQWVKN